MLARIFAHTVLAAVCYAQLVACAEDTPPPDIAKPITKPAPDLTPDATIGSTLPEITAALQNGEITAEALVQRYLDRIELVDRRGPTLQSVLSLNPNALKDARRLDAQRASGEPLGALHGIPVLLKDNIETLDPVATTAGAIALKANVTGRDSPLVAGLRAAGAIVLGKTNLSQWANFRSNDSVSGWSAMGGQVRNPHMLDRSPCGSSSGSGVAAAASLAAATVGTETNGSIICPANVNGVVGFKPTLGLVSQQHIVPIASSQDTAGPITKSVTGAAMMLNAMATGAEKTDYLAGLNESALRGARIGVLRFAQGSNADIIERFDEAIVALRAAGAQIIEIDTFAERDDTFWKAARDVMYYEFKATINDYLANAAPEVTTRSLGELIAFNEANAERELALFDQGIFDEANTLGDLQTPEYLAARDYVKTFTGRAGIDALLNNHSADVLISPSGPVASRVDPINGDVWPNWAGAGWMAAGAGYPHLSVPMGTVHGIPVGLSFIGGENRDAAVLAYGYAYEQQSTRRVTPAFLTNAEERKEIGRAVRRP
ncbi:MAG: amidase [Gammaproteobacteria bacterium]